MSSFLVIVQYKIIWYTRNGTIFTLLQNDFTVVTKYVFLSEFPKMAGVLPVTVL